MFIMEDLPARTRLPVFVWGTFVTDKDLPYVELSLIRNQGLFRLGTPYTYLSILAHHRCPATKLNDPYGTNLVVNVRFIQHEAGKLMRGTNKLNVLVRNDASG